MNTNNESEKHERNVELSEQDIARLDELHEYVWDHQPEYGVDPIETMWKAIDWYFKEIDSWYEKPTEEKSEDVPFDKTVFEKKE